MSNHKTAPELTELMNAADKILNQQGFFKDDPPKASDLWDIPSEAYDAAEQLSQEQETGGKKEPENRRFLVRDLYKKEYVILVNADDPRYEIVYEFYIKQFPDLKCEDCGIVSEDVKYRDWGNGVQCYNCHRDDQEFEEEYK